MLLFQAFVWLDHGEPAKAIASLNESVRLDNEVIRTEFRLEAEALLCWYYTTLGAFEIAAEEYKGSRRPNQEVKIPQFQVLIWSLNALYEIASGQLKTAEATLRDCTFDLKLPGTTWAHLAKCQLAFARGDYPAAISIARGTAAYMRQAGLDQFMPDLLLVQARAHLHLGEPELAQETLQQATAAAERLGSRRIEWQILAALANLEEDPLKSIGLRKQARDVIQYVADHAGANELRRTFLSLPEVRAVMDEREESQEEASGS